MTFDDEVVAEASKGDSDGGMFLEYEGDFYLVGTTVWVDSTASTSTITFGEIESDMEYKTKYSHTYGVILKDFLYEIGQITGVNISEPSTYAMLLGLLSLVAVGGGHSLKQ